MSNRLRHVSFEYTVNGKPVRALTFVERLYWKAACALGSNSRFLERRPKSDGSFEYYSWPSPKLFGGQWFRWM